MFLKHTKFHPQNLIAIKIWHQLKQDNSNNLMNNSLFHCKFRILLKEYGDCQLKKC